MFPSLVPPLYRNQALEVDEEGRGEAEGLKRAGKQDQERETKGSQSIQGRENEELPYSACLERSISQRDPIIRLK